MACHLVSAPVCDTLITNEGFGFSSLTGNLARDPVTNIVTFFLAPLQRITVCILFLSKRKLRQSLLCWVRINICRNVREEEALGRGRGQTNVHRPGKIGQSHEDLWNEYVLSELSYNGINCVDPSLDMGHTGKTWPWEKYFL